MRGRYPSPGPFSCALKTLSGPQLLPRAPKLPGLDHDQPLRSAPVNNAGRIPGEAGTGPWSPRATAHPHPPGRPEPGYSSPQARPQPATWTWAPAGHGTSALGQWATAAAARPPVTPCKTGERSPQAHGPLAARPRALKEQLLLQSSML